MKISFVIITAVILHLAGMPLSAGEACVRTEFKTKGYKEACEKGGQKAAKDFAKAFLKTAIAKKPGTTCQSCHTSLAPNYPLKPDALTQFSNLGGALLVSQPATGHKPAKPQKDKPAQSDQKKNKTGDDCADKKKEPPRAGAGCSIN